MIRKALSADHDVSLTETNRRGHATRLAQGAAADGTDVVVVLGGDGTLNEAANGLAGTQTALAALPGGSTNVFARTIGLPNDPIEATGDLLDALDRHFIRRVGLGWVNGRYFLFHVGMGYDAAVVAQVERRSGLKRYAGHPLFVYAAVVTWFRHFDPQRAHFSIHFGAGGPDDSSRTDPIEDGRFALCLNTNPYTFFGNRPLDIAPEAVLDRGLVSVTVRSMNFVQILRIASAAVRGGERLRRLPYVDLRPDLSRLEVLGHGPFPYQVDGDYLGETEHLEFRHEPAVLDLVLPVNAFSTQ